MRRRLDLLAVLLAALAGCGGEPAPPSATFVELLDALANVRVLRAAASLDIGTPGARPALREGWSFDETSSEAGTFAWGLGSSSTLELVVAEVRDLELFLHGKPFVYPGAPVQVVTAEVNGRPAGTAELPAAGAELRFSVPASSLEPGSNELTLYYGYSAQPADWYETEDRRDLAVAWSLLEVRTSEAAGDAAIESMDSRLILAGGTLLDYYLQVPAGASLVIDRIARMPQAGAADSKDFLSVEVARDGTPPVTARLDLSMKRQALPLTDGGGIVRLSLRSHVFPGNADVQVVLDRPRITVPATAKPSTADAGTSRPTTSKPNILIYLVDTLRADRMGCYGYERSITPHADAFAEDAIVFDDAIAQSPWTRPSVASLFTGLRPVTHGVEGRRHQLPETAMTLAEILRGEGYETVAYLANPNVAGWFGLRQGFDVYRLFEKAVWASRLNEEATAWLQVRSPGAPFFLYLHTVDPHGPYQPSELYRERFAADVRDPAVSTRAFMKRVARGELDDAEAVARQLSDLYDAEVAMNDAAFGALLETLRRNGLYEETVIVFVSDHGEEFLEHGRWEHGKSLYTEVIDVPLIVRFPGVSSRRVSIPVQHVDVLPTLLAFAGIEAPPGLEGRNLLALLENPEDGIVFSSVALGEYRGRSATSRRYRLIVPESTALGSEAELYDRLEDPDETRNLASELPITTRFLRVLLDSAGADAAPVPEVNESQLDPEILERMRALGYMD